VSSFTAEVLSSGQGGHAVVVPAASAESFARRRTPVVATVNGVEYRSRMMVYGGRTYLGLRKDFLRQLGVGVGDQITVELREDLEERVVVEPPELLQALDNHPAARQAYDALSFTHRMEYARWIDEGKKPETRAERVAKTIRRLAGS
jgi:hypothetical protein